QRRRFRVRRPDRPSLPRGRRALAQGPASLCAYAGAVTANAVPGFLPSRNGFRFANSWPAGPARTWHLGLVHLGIGDVGRGLCGGMAFAARDRFARGESSAPDTTAPTPGSPLFIEIVDRQFDSFG